MTELLTDAHFWVGIAFLLFVAILVMVGIHKLVWKTLGDAGTRVQAQLNEAEQLRAEAQALLADIKVQRTEAERQAAVMLQDAKEAAQRLQADSKVKLAEQIERRGRLAEQRIATAEAQAAADVKAAAAELAARMAEDVLMARVAGTRSDPLIDAAIGQIAGRLQ